ncbi:hypothetical protein STEG23_022863, partial [Scotinomys teguina]
MGYEVVSHTKQAMTQEVGSVGLSFFCPANTSSVAGNECPAGHYCPAATTFASQFPCPRGTYKPQRGGIHRSDCSPCEPETGKRFSDGPCLAGYYCPPGQTSATPTSFRCPQGFYCPEGSPQPKACGNGTYQPQEAQGSCELCPMGFYCEVSSTGDQKGLFPSVLRAEHESPCEQRCNGKGTYWLGVWMPCHDQGHFCQPGAAWPVLCHRGHYQSSLGSDTCLSCPPGSYCPYPGTQTPRPCPAHAYCQAGAVDMVPCRAGSYCGPRTGVPPLCPGGFACPAGSSTYTGPGQRRANAKLVYEFYSWTLNYQRTEGGSPQMSVCEVAQHCPPGDVRLAATRECVSPQQYDCSSFCGPGGGKLSTTLGICQCLGYVSAEELCDIRCLAIAPQLSLSWDPGKELTLSVKTGTGDSIQKEIFETLGPDLQFPGSARVHLVQFGPRGTFGFIISRVDMLISVLQGTAVSSPWLQRHRRTIGPKHHNADPQIPNPVICLAAGDVILFQLHLLPHNRLASHYPVYQRQHLLNSNSHWDSGAFRRLGHLVRETNLSLSRFAHQFLDPGTYVFQDNGKPENIAVVLVKEEGTACGAGLSPVQPSSPYQLGRLGVFRHSMLTLGPDWGVITGEPPQVLTLEDFSVRTLYDKLEDQSLHVAAQLSRHREDALAFYRAASQQLQGLRDFLQGTSLTELPSLVRDKHPEPGVKTHMETVTGESEEPQEARASHTASSQTDSWQLASGCTPSLSPLGFQPELNRAVTALASALSQAREPPVGASRKASSQHDGQSSFTNQRDSPMMGQPPFDDQEPQSIRPQQTQEPFQIPKQDVKGKASQTPSHEKWILGAGLRHRPDVELQWAAVKLVTPVKYQVQDAALILGYREWQKMTQHRQRDRELHSYEIVTKNRPR